MQVHSDLHAVVILANIEWAAQQTCGAEISVAHRKIVSKYRYNHSHYTDSIREVLKILAKADAVQDLRKAKAPGELAEIFNKGTTRIQKLVQHKPAAPQYHSDSDEERANSATTTDREGPAPRKGRRKQKEK